MQKYLRDKRLHSTQFTNQALYGMYIPAKDINLMITPSNTTENLL